MEIKIYPQNCPQNNIREIMHPIGSYGKSILKKNNKNHTKKPNNKKLLTSELEVWKLFW